MNNRWRQHPGVYQTWLAPVHESCLWTSLPNSTFRSLKSTTVGVFIPILAFSPESQLLNIYQHITALFYKQLTPRWGRDQLRDSRGCGPEGSLIFPRVHRSKGSCQDHWGWRISETNTVGASELTTIPSLQDKGPLQLRSLSRRSLRKRVKN